MWTITTLNSYDHKTVTRWLLDNYPLRLITNQAIDNIHCRPVILFTVSADNARIVSQRLLSTTFSRVWNISFLNPRYSDFFSYLLNRIHFGRIRWQRNNLNIVGNIQPLGFLPCRTICNHMLPFDIIVFHLSGEVFFFRLYPLGSPLCFQRKTCTGCK